MDSVSTVLPMKIETARNILEEWTTSEALLRHANTVAEVMRQYALKFGEDSEQWLSLIHI